MGSHFEMADGNDPEQIVKATQRGLVKMMKGILLEIKADLKTPGLTWTQLEHFLDEVGKKQLQVTIMDDEVIN